MCTNCGCGDETADAQGPIEHDPRHDRHARHDHDHLHGDHHHHDHDHDHPRRSLRLERDLLAKNDRLAAENRVALARRKLAVFNLIGSPGAGKTALLEATIHHMRSEMALAVLEGDQATDRDARRIESAGCPVVQINTGAGCHLDASMVARGVHEVAPPRSSILFIENVGNLVCPALFDLGEHAKAVVMSVTEGEDKPLKYPHVFRAASVLVLTKVDLLPYIAFDVERCIAYAREVNPRLSVIRVAAPQGAGLDVWCDWVRSETARALEIAAP
jgi:hydrogenase nickel incorporation protein HypB